MNYSRPVIAAQNFAASFRFYHELLGLELVRGTVDSPSVAFRSGGTDLVLLNVHSAPRETAGLFGTGGHHVSVIFVFDTDDVDAEVSRLRAQGVEFAVNPIDLPDWGTRIAVCRDPDGNAIELVSPLPDAA